MGRGKGRKDRGKGRDWKGREGERGGEGVRKEGEGRGDRKGKKEKEKIGPGLKIWIVDTPLLSGFSNGRLRFTWQRVSNRCCTCVQQEVWQFPFGLLPRCSASTFGRQLKPFLYTWSSSDRRVNFALSLSLYSHLSTNASTSVTRVYRATVCVATVFLSTFCPSVCLSVCSTRALWQNEIIICQYINAIW